METAPKIRLTSIEVGTLWTTYENDTMAKCILRYFLNTVEDPEIRTVIEYALSLCEKHLQELTLLFNSENFSIPHGFSDKDVNVHAKRLFSDSLFLNYLKNMAKVGLATFATAYSISSRADIRQFYRECLNQTEILDQKAIDVLQSKGIYIRPPYITLPDKVKYVSDKSFLSGGFFGFTDKRPVISIEIAHLYMNIETNILGKALMMGFSQVTVSQEIREYLLQGKEIAGKHIKIFSEVLTDDDIPASMTWDAEVTDSTEPPFSDKLILHHVAMLIAAGTGNYGLAAAASPRKDIAANYVRLAAEIAQYAEAGAKILIEKGWLEEPPQAPNRKQLAQQV
jgi:hypothetical protein